MQTILELFSQLTNPELIVKYGGLYIVLLIVFAETGLFVGFFLPGDSLLFIAGTLIAATPGPTDSAAANLVYWTSLIAVAGIAGNYVGYWFGRQSGRMLLDRRDTWLFKKKYLEQACAFYEKRGGGAIVLARFLPVVRTFAPIVAGMVRMDFGKFSFYNVLGSVLWTGSIVSAGFLLGEHPWVKDNLEKVILGIVVLSTAPVLLKIIAGSRKKVSGSWTMVSSGKNGRK